MMNASVLYLQQLIQQDLFRMDALSLKEVNPTKYGDLKSKFTILDSKLGHCLDDSEADIFSLKMEYARISAELDFYLSFLNGVDEVYRYRVEKVKGILESLFKKLNGVNYLEVEQELENTLNLMKEIVDSSAKSLKVIDLINKIKYEIFKYKFDDQIIDDDYQIASNLPLILNDIKKIVNDPSILPYIKDKLRNYIINPNAILDNYQEVILLVNLSRIKGLTEERIAFELNERRYYHSNDLKNEFVRDDEVWNKSIDFSKNVKYYVEEIDTDKTLNLTVRVIQQICLDTNLLYAEKIFSLEESFKNLKIASFKRWKELFQGLIFGLDGRGSANVFRRILDSNYIKENIPDLLYYIERALITYLEELNGRENFSDIISFALDYKIEYILKYVIKSNISVDKDFVDSVININNPRLMDGLAYVKDLELLDYVIDILRKDNKDYILHLDRYVDLLSSSREEQISYLKSIIKKYAPCNCKLELEKLEEYNDYNLFIDLIKLQKDTSEILFIINGIKDSKIKHDVDQWMYNEMDKLYDIPYEEKKGNNFYYLSLHIENNKYAAYYATKSIRISRKDISVIIAKYGRDKLNWNNILYSAKDSLSDEELDVFCEYYEKELENEGITLDEKVEKTLFNEKSEDIFPLIHYLVHKGMHIGNLILWYNLTSIDSYQELILKAIKNCTDSLERVHYYQKFLFKNNELCQKFDKDKILKMEMDMILLTNKELEEVKNQISTSDGEKANYLDAKLRRYYWDLIKLMEVLSGVERRRIALYIARSNYAEHINYIATNYGEYLDLLMENVADYGIRASLMNANSSPMVPK